MIGFLTGIVGAFAEAWQEVRIHKGRVLLSLVGVAVAVCALTASVALSDLVRQVTIEQSETYGGRPVTLAMSMDIPEGSSTSREEATAAWYKALERYDISYATRVYMGSLKVQFVDGVEEGQITVVDPAYAEIHRTRMDEGSWFAPDDGQRLAPAIVVNNAFWERLGSPPLESHPTITLPSMNNATVVIIGVYATSSWDDYPAAMMLTDSFSRIAEPAELEMAVPMYEAWVPTTNVKALTKRLEADMTAAIGEDGSVSINRQDFGASADDSTIGLRITTMVIGGIILLLGALSLLNIALVTVRQRIREIGIRRSFGATAGRVFFSVMMESVVATIVAGIAGVIAAVLIVKNPMIEEFFTQGMISDIPPFPIAAATFGLVSATIVGALAGLIPALIAVRVKVIDAIRF